jgi:hypothetical protein
MHPRLLTKPAHHHPVNKMRERKREREREKHRQRETRENGQMAAICGRVGRRSQALPAQSHFALLTVARSSFA